MNLCLVLLSVTLACLVLLSSLHTAHSQAYHFSNGWHPGKKRSSSSTPSFSPDHFLTSLRTNKPSSVLRPAANQCELRPSIKKLILDLVEMEMRRVSQECEWGSLWEHGRDRNVDSDRYPGLPNWLLKHSEGFVTNGEGVVKK